ncbi:MAG: glycosyltransferase family 10 [Planctomycetaceae bacterium]
MAEPNHIGDIRVKMLAKGGANFPMDRVLGRFPNKDGVWGRCRFLYDLNERDYDWLVVYDDLTCLPSERTSTRIEELACSAKHTLLVTSEPSSVKIYAPSFTSQFETVLTSQEPWALQHRNAVYSQCGLVWFYSCDYASVRDNLPLQKTGDLATVCSSKQQRHTLHHLRYSFTQRLREALPEMDVFGRGVRPIDDKREALDPYRYHLAIENHVCPHHWTEKLADSFLGLTVPFYYGCPNVFDYFPEGAVVPIDIRDFDGSVETIRKAIKDKHWEKNFAAVQEARRRVLEDYHLFAVVERMILERHDPARTDRGALVRSRKAARNQNVFTFVSHGLQFVRTRLWHTFH